MKEQRGALLTILAVLFALGAIQDFLKPFRFEGPNTALVVMGTRLHGPLNIVMSIVLGIFLAIYAAGVWRMSRYALILALIYAAHVTINIIVFPIRYRGEDNGPILLQVMFTVLALAIPWTAATVLWRRRAELA